MMKKGRSLAISLSAAQRNGKSEERLSVGVTVGEDYQDGYDIAKNQGYYCDERTFERPLEVEKGNVINFQTRESSRTNAWRVAALLISDVRG